MSTQASVDVAEPSERQVREDLAAAYRLFALFGMDDGIYTHLSVRVPGRHDHFLINPFGTLFSEVTASSLLKIDLNGTDKEGDRLSYNYHNADLTDLDGHAEITVSPSGAGVFRWTPLAADVGQHAFDFSVSDGSNATTVTINIDVKSAIGSATAPVFRQPLGTGTTLDMTKSMCVDLNIVIEDQDSAQVTITQEEPLIDGATLTPQDGLSASWHWCPTRAQQSETRYTLVLSADDGDNPKTIKNYLVVLRTGGGQNCPGQAPVIDHTPMDVTTILDLAPTATISDDKGLKDTPLFYYSMTQPANPPDLGHMTQLSMILISGDNKSGTYTAAVPNPVATMPNPSRAANFRITLFSDQKEPKYQRGNRRLQPKGFI